ncbi:hypothetical protein DL96DRAFT_886620 [Flagelloscypha sp. PMI_526]|nr:hypothetical protein DL96DRAFT_886620 [Flagelloscypha sp. PMI_526]
MMFFYFRFLAQEHTAATPRRSVFYLLDRICVGDDPSPRLCLARQYVRVLTWKLWDSESTFQNLPHYLNNLPNLGRRCWESGTFCNIGIGLPGVYSIHPLLFCLEQPLPNRDRATFVAHSLSRSCLFGGNDIGGHSLSFTLGHLVDACVRDSPLLSRLLLCTSISGSCLVFIINLVVGLSTAAFRPLPAGAFIQPAWANFIPQFSYLGRYRLLQ